MRTFTKLLFTTATLSLLTISCKDDKKQLNTEKATSEQKETKTEDPSTMKKEDETKTTMVFNANLATKEDLTKIGVPSTIVTQIIEKRPFLSMNDLDAIVGDTVNKEELYKKVFVPFNLNTTAEWRMNLKSTDHMLV